MRVLYSVSVMYNLYVSVNFVIYFSTLRRQDVKSVCNVIELVVGVLRTGLIS